MAERRMFAKTIVLSDEFLDMPLSARCLYFTLGMFADDDGFVNSPKGIMRQCGASQDDMKILIEKNYVLVFESGVIVISHWRINNYLRNDRYQKTKYIEEKNSLILDESGTYSFGIPNSGTPNIGIPNMGIHSIGKDSIDKNSIDKDSIGNINGDSDVDYELFFDEVWEKYPRKKGKGSISAGTKKRLYKEVGLEQMLRCVERYKKYIADHNITEEYIKYGSTFFNSGYMDYLDENYGGKQKKEVEEKQEPPYFDCYGLAHPTDKERYPVFDRFRNLTKEEIQHYIDKGSFDMEEGTVAYRGYLTFEDMEYLRSKGVIE